MPLTGNMKDDQRNVCHLEKIQWEDFQAAMSCFSSMCCWIPATVTQTGGWVREANCSAQNTGRGSQKMQEKKYWRIGEWINFKALVLKSSFVSCFRPSEFSSIYPRWVWPPQSHGRTASGAALQSIRAPGTKVPLAEGQRPLGARQPLPADGHGAAHREHAALGLGQLCLRGVEQLRHRRDDRAPLRQT